MSLAQEGVRCHLVHRDTGMYVCPQGGQAHPANNTPLVFVHHPTNLQACEFCFTNLQLQHVASGKYVHPFGGAARDNAQLVLYDGSDGTRTSIRMVAEKGRTFLKKDSFYVHPQGGNAVPNDNTPLVYYNGVRPELAIEFRPVQQPGSPSQVSNFHLPREGLPYLLMHFQSGKYVQPANGAENPGKSTPLVFAELRNERACHFVFTRGQLQHAASRLFVHPFGGAAANEQLLVLYEGSDGKRTAINMSSEGGRTYLRKEDFYVHPKGGQAVPTSGTQLVFHTDFRPELAIVIKPIGM